MSVVERTSAGLQTVIPGCERRTLPKSTSRVDEDGQGLLHFYKPPNLGEQLARHECTFATETRTKGIAQSWLVRFISGRGKDYRQEVRRASIGQARPVEGPPIRPAPTSSSV